MKHATTVGRSRCGYNPRSCGVMGPYNYGEKSHPLDARGWLAADSKILVSAGRCETPPLFRSESPER